MGCYANDKPGRVCTAETQFIVTSHHARRQDGKRCTDFTFEVCPGHLAVFTLDLAFVLAANKGTTCRACNKPCGTLEECATIVAKER